MKILWITNIPLPPLCEKLKWPIPSVGGWMYSSLKTLLGNSEISLGVATVWDGKEFLEKKINNITYYLLPLNGSSKIKYNKKLEKYWEQINTSFKPNVIHIHGSEFPHGLAWVKANGGDNVCVSIQGLVDVCSRYYKTDKLFDYFPLTFRDLVKFDWISKQKKSFEKRGTYEKKLLKSIKHIIGRTQWDKAHLWAINPNAKYYHVGETLRDSFYKHKWKYETCIPHTIFVSQASYPIKGLHILLEALPLVLREFPDTRVYVSGTDIHNKPWYKLSSYGKYLKKTIKKNYLEGIVSFTGLLDEEQMCEQYLRSNLFVCCSAIENSPNSLGEAQLLGMPHLASYVGGIPDIVNNNPNILYRFEESEMLAQKICDIFELKDKFSPITFNEKLYDKDINTDALVKVYRDIHNS